MRADDVRDFLANRRGRCGLAVGSRQHGLAGEIVCHLAQRAQQFVDCRQDDLVARVAQHQRIGEVVDVFARAGEVDEFLDGLDLSETGAALLEQVFDRLDVVVGLAFDRLDAFGVVQRKPSASVVRN